MEGGRLPGTRRPVLAASMFRTVHARRGRYPMGWSADARHGRGDAASGAGRPRKTVRRDRNHGRINDRVDGPPDHSGWHRGRPLGIDGLVASAVRVTTKAAIDMTCRSLVGRSRHRYFGAGEAMGLSGMDGSGSDKRQGEHERERADGDRPPTAHCLVGPNWGSRAHGCLMNDSGPLVHAGWPPTGGKPQ